tara:strand:- start:1982 stop:2122 length:141 start_codon:yes stop_codon:yes gene_type:complete
MVVKVKTNKEKHPHRRDRLLFMIKIEVRMKGEIEPHSVGATGVLEP